MLAGGNQLWIASDPVAVSETTRGSCLHFDGVQGINYSMQVVHTNNSVHSHLIM